MTDLSPLGIGLSTVFALTLVSLLAELTYFICFRRNLHHQQTRVEPTITASPPLPTDARDPHEEHCVLEKWHEMYGPSRVLFTIEEEEREEMESDKSCSERKITTRVFLEDSFEKSQRGGGDLEVEVDLDAETPFSTPCGSPPYYTPSPRDGNVRETMSCSVEGLSGMV